MHISKKLYFHKWNMKLFIFHCQGTELWVKHYTTKCKTCFSLSIKFVYTVMSRLSGLRSSGKFAIRTEFWGNGFFLLYFDSITSEIRVPEPDVNIWEPMYRNNRIPARWSGNNLIGDLFSHPEIIRWSTSLSNRRLNLFEKVWYFPKHTTTTGKTLTFCLYSSETN